MQIEGINKSGARCSHGACVDAKPVAGGILVTSTIEGNDGSVTFTTVEWDAFVGQVKRGEWDHTLNGGAGA